MSEEKINFILVVGTPAEGFTNYGPFNSYGEAEDWAEANLDEDSWWVDTLLHKLAEK